MNKLAPCSLNYDFDRIQTVTKNILRLAVFELFFDPSIPPKVAIAEAIRLSRKFSTPESAAFVNALLDHLYRQSRGEEGNQQKLEQTSHDFMQSETLASDAAQTKQANEGK